MAKDTSIVVQAEHVKKEVLNGASTLTILHDVSLSIKQGESIAILGASGSGKTTLLTLLAGLDLPTQGNVYLQGQMLNHLNEEQRAKIRAENIGFIFQSFYLLPTLTAFENVCLPLELQGKEKEASVKAESLLQRVGLSHRLNHYPYQLSGGEQQRVAVARAFISHPKILFADEITGNLDNETGKSIIDLLFELNAQQHTTLILVTHDQFLASLCERRYLLKNGQIYAQ